MKTIHYSVPHRLGSVFAPVLVLAALLLGVVAGPAESATFAPGDVFAAGDIFAAVVGGKVLWYRPSLSGSPTLMGTLDTGVTRFTTGMAFDASGNLYVTDWDSNSVTKLDGPSWELDGTIRCPTRRSDNSF